MIYLASKDDDFIDDPGRLVLQELLNDVFTDCTSPNDGKVCVSRHELTVLFVVCAWFWSHRYFSFLYLSYPLSQAEPRRHPS